ncbi:MAG: hypothetical protein RL410_1370 [Actinomycetota bacterium]
MAASFSTYCVHCSKRVSGGAHNVFVRTIAISESSYWPSEVSPVGHPDHERTLVKWLLDNLPSDIRAVIVMHRHLPVLLHFADSYFDNALDGVRQAYATARADLGAHVPPEVIAAALKGIEVIGSTMRSHSEFVAVMREMHCED